MTLGFAWIGASGLGSVYTRTVRDSLPTALGVGAFIGMNVLVAGAGMADSGGADTRAQIADLARSAPAAMQGMYGPPLQVETLGGFLAWQYAGFFGLIVGLWSILSLSGTLAGERARGSLDLLLATPLGRRRLATEKIAGAVTALTAGLAVFAVCLWLSGAVFGNLPGDAISPLAAAAFAAHVGLGGLVFGALAFCLAALAGRRTSIGLAAAFMLGGYVAQGWSGEVPILRPIAILSPFHWIANDVPLAQAPDPLPVLMTGVAAIVLLAVGTELFAKGEYSDRSLRLPGLPGLPLGLGGPFGRSFAERLPASLGFGLGLGSYGFVMAASSRSFGEAMTGSPGMASMFDTVFPGADIRTSAGALEIAYLAFAFVAVGLAAAVLVDGWASDEASGRLEMILSTPHSRVRVTALAGIGAFAGIAVMTGLAGGGVVLGCLTSGENVAISVGVLALGLYSAALFGVGIAVGGTLRPSLAGPIVALAAIGTFAVGIFGAVLHLPDAVRQAALTSHLDRAMTGGWETAGVLGALALAAGGLALGAWGMRRRDLAR